MNLRFGLTYDAKKYQDNAYVGANYLAWLTRYFGKAYFKDKYDLSASKCKSHTSTNVSAQPGHLRVTTRARARSTRRGRTRACPTRSTWIRCAR